MSQSISNLVVQATTGEPRDLPHIYGFVTRLRPGTAKETIRARVYEAVDKKTVVRIAEGVYLAVGEQGTALVVQGDAWEALEAMDENALDLIITDQPYDLGTKANVGIGTTRPHAEMGGRSYELRDLDERWLRAAFRALKKTGHRWRNLSTGQDRNGPGALIFFTPKFTRQTRKNIQALLDLAERVGFVYQGVMTWDRDTMGMGYAFGRSQIEWLHLFTAGERGGVGWDLGMRDIVRAKTMRNATNGEKHESEKPVEVFMTPIRFCAKPGDILMDPFGGRASWVRVALSEGYNVVINEINPKWVDNLAAEMGYVAGAS